MVDIIFVGMVFESVIILFMLILVILTLKKYNQIRNRPTLYLLLIFFNVLVGIVYSWLSKIIVLTTNIEYLYNNPNATYPNTPVYWILLRIVDFRIALAFLALSVLFSHLFKINVFEEEYNKTKRVIFLIYVGFCIFFTIFIYERGNTLLDAFNFMFSFTLVTITYIPFMLKSIRSYKISEKSFIKKKLLSLILMSLCFNLVLLCFLIDRILVLLGNPHFTIFYFLAWIIAVIGIISAYVGFIMPKISEI